MDQKKIDELFDAFDPERDSIIDMVKNFRGMTRRRLNLLETLLISQERAARTYRTASHGGAIFNLTDEQVKFTYPAASKPDFNYETQYDQDFTVENEKLLNDLVPEIIPDEDYFEEVEKPCIYGNEHPMSSSPAEFIRKLLLFIIIKSFRTILDGESFNRVCGQDQIKSISIYKI